ncbi:unnamed protein product [Caretta caretta]
MACILYSASCSEHYSAIMTKVIFDILTVSFEYLLFQEKPCRRLFLQMFLLDFFEVPVRQCLVAVLMDG